MALLFLDTSNISEMITNSIYGKLYESSSLEINISWKIAEPKY